MQPRSSPCRHLRVCPQQLLNRSGFNLGLLDSLSAQNFSASCIMRSSSVRDKRPFSLMTPRLLVVEGLLARGLYFGIHVGLPQAPRHAGSPARYLCLAGTSPRGPWNCRVVHAKLLHCSLDLSRRHLELFFGFSSFVCAHNETLVSWTVLGLKLTCWARFQHRTLCFLHHAINHSLRQRPSSLLPMI